MFVGAGVSDIVFDKAMFPVEGFNGVVADNPHARVLIIDNGEKVAIVSLELVNAPEDVITEIRSMVSRAATLDIENVWVHSTHAISTPHAPVDIQGSKLFADAVEAATESALIKAVNSMQEAKVGVETGICDINSNRNIVLNGELYYGLGSTFPSNKELTIIRFDTLDNSPIAFLVSYGIKPTCIYNVEQNTNTRQISADVPGYACIMMENRFNVPCLFCMPAAGDQIPKWIAMYYALNESGEVTFVEHPVAEAIFRMRELGSEMGNVCIDLADRIISKPCSQTLFSQTSFEWPNKAGDGEVSISVESIIFGDNIALVGLKPEVNSVTEKDLWNRSPYKHTLIVSFLNGDQKYMPEKEAYERKTREWARSGCGKGCAEQFVNVAVETLKKAKKGDVVRLPRNKDRKCVDSLKKMSQKIEFGGISWIVLDTVGDNKLVVSEYVLEERSYHSSLEPVTWEKSAIRTYLNTEFYERFSEEEKQKIVLTEIENKSNTKYGVSGGNPTNDKVFLLSLQETENFLFGFTHLIVSRNVNSKLPAWWYLRSPGEGLEAAANVDASGIINYHGHADGVRALGGIRPAMWIKW